VKLIIQIPCLNEALTLPAVVKDLPKEVPGFTSVQYLVIDDGSTDGTAEVARHCGVHHVIQHCGNQGLSRAFMTGLEYCLELDADVIVNTDGDNQYSGADVPLLTEPITSGVADVVVGARPIRNSEHFSTWKKILQLLGSWVVRVASGTDVTDAPSGFRAFSKEAAKRFVVFNDYTYTLETIIQAGRRGLRVQSVPISVNGKTRESRLFSSTWGYVSKSTLVIIRVFAIYRPFRFLGSLGAILIAGGLVIGLRFVWFFLEGEGDGHIQSLILAAIFILLGAQAIIAAFLADLAAANRKLLEDIRYSGRRK